MFSESICPIRAQLQKPPALEAKAEAARIFLQRDSEYRKCMVTGDKDSPGKEEQAEIVPGRFRFKRKRTWRRKLR